VTVESKAAPMKTEHHLIWRSHVVPTVLLRNELHKHEKSVLKEFSDSKDGWAAIIAHRATRYNFVGIEGNLRSMRAIMSNSTMTTHINNAEALLMACGVMLDADTDIPTLPGNKKLCAEMLFIRAEIIDPSVVMDDIMHLVPELAEVTRNLIDDPLNYKKYQDQAPLDALRAPHYNLCYTE
jgi:hypothetical protein